MGCSASTSQSSDVVGTDLRLPNSKLKFSIGQLKILNKKLLNISDESKAPLLSEDAECIAERLIQGLVYGAAAKDARFKSKFIVVLHKYRICKSSSLEYLVLLDALDGNCDFGEGPPGCARLRPQDHISREWYEFLSPSGFLRRDKIIERWVEILAMAAADGVAGSGSESQLSTAPGHLLPPVVLQRLRTFKSQEQCFYGNVKEGGQFPSSRDYRIAIVESNPWVRVRLAGGILGNGAEAKLALGIAYHGWPAGSDFPARIPLGHPDAILFYKASQMGFFVVGGGPGPGVQWSERSAGWQVWAESARSMLANRGDGVMRVGRVCSSVLSHLRSNGQPPLRAVSRFMVEEALLWRAEKTVGRGLASDLRSWTANHLAHHVLYIYDMLLGEIKTKTGRHYFFDGCDMVKMTVWRGARIAERDWRGDAESIYGFLKRFHDESLQKTEEGIEAFATVQEQLESALCSRWSLLLQELMPAGSTKGRRLAGAPPYSPRQLAYLSAVCRELLAARQLVIQESIEWYHGNINSTLNQYHEPIEDLIHLLAIILDQARDLFIKTNFGTHSSTHTLMMNNKKSSMYTTGESSKNTIKKQKLKNCFDASATYLIDSLRRDPDVQKEDLVNDSVLVRTLLNWLYRSVDEDKKYLSPVLKPYLDLLFTTSHENCWHLEEFKSRTNESELESLMLFCKMVGEGSIGPADGILEATLKGWQWAENILDTLDDISNMGAALRMSFYNSNEGVLNFDLSLPNDPCEKEIWHAFHANRQKGYVAKIKLAEKYVVEAFDYGLDQDVNVECLVQSTSKSEEILNEKFDSYSYSSIHNTINSEQRFDNNNKYHTIRSVDSKYSTLRNSDDLFGSSWWCGNTIKLKNGIKRPIVHGKLKSLEPDQVFSTPDEIDYSLHCTLRDMSPMTMSLQVTSNMAPHREYTGIIKALIAMQKYSVLQELAGWLPNGEEKVGVFKALHRLARGGRRASGPATSSAQKPALSKNNYSLSPKKANLQSKQRASIRQYYRKRNIDALSGDESNNNKQTEMKSTTEDVEKVCSDNPLDLQIQKEYLENKLLNNNIEQMTEMNERYMELCKEAIRNSQEKMKKSSFSKFDKEIKNLRKASKKENALSSSSMGRNAGKEIKLHMKNYSATLGRKVKTDMEVSANSLLGTCRKARLHQVARKSIVPRSTVNDENVFGDAFKISTVYSPETEYDLMTQSILQNSSLYASADRQRHLGFSRQT